MQDVGVRAEDEEQEPEMRMLAKGYSGVEVERKLETVQLLLDMKARTRGQATAPGMAEPGSDDAIVGRAARGLWLRCTAQL